MALIKCSQCKKQISSSAKFCVHCGEPVEKKKICKECGKPLKEGALYCTNCGKKVSPNVKKEITKVRDDVLSSKKKTTTVSIVIVAAIILVVVTITATALSGPNMSNVYYDVCGSSYYCDLSGDGNSIIVDTNPYDIDDYFSQSAWELVLELNEELGLPNSVEEKMLQTRAIDGTLSSTHGKITVTWKYHPDQGLSVVYEK